MSLVRPIVVALLLLAWGQAVNGCVLASVAPRIFSDCCDDSPGAGCDSSQSSCEQCVNVETGLATSLLHAVKVEPVVKEDVWQRRILRLLSERSDVNAQIVDHCYTPPERPLWHFVARTALPVRGPSIS